jgi:hypothetical protein
VDQDQQRRNLSRIRSSATWTGIRLRLSDALRWFVATLPIPLLVSLVSLAVIKVYRLDWAGSRPYIVAVVVSLLIVVAAVLYQMLRRRPPYEGAIALDRHHGLHDRLTNALFFSERPAAERSELMDLAVGDGCAHAENLKPRKAAPIRFPPMVALPVGLIVALAAIAVLEIRVYRMIAEAKTIDAVTLTADDIDYFRDSIKDMENRKQDAEVQQAIDKFNQLVEDIANKRLERTEAFRRMEALDRELRAGTAADKKAVEEGLKRIAEELRKSDLTKEAANALANKKLDEAEKKLKDLAQRMREKPKSFSKQELENLRKALEEASKRNEERRKELENRRDELQKEMDRLLKNKKERPDGGADEQEERLLRKKRRELEQLNRQLEEQQRAGRQLSRLDRELAEAAANLARDLGLSAEDLENSAEDLNRMAREQMTDQEKEELRRRIQQMRELMRQQGQGGKPRMVRLRRFSERARGGSGQRGQGQRGQGQQPGGEQPGGEQPGGQGQQPGGNGGGEEVWVIGPDGQKVLVLKSSGGSGSGSQPGGGDQPGGQGDQPGGKSWGTGHDPNISGNPTNPKMGTQDVTASGVDTGQGPSRAEVIYGAAERGFVGKGYQKVFTEYETVAEKAIDKEDIPPGYRFYVQRYFQLIRPRE